MNSVNKGDNSIEGYFEGSNQEGRRFEQTIVWSEETEKKTTESKCLDLEATTTGLIRDVEKIREVNETLKKSF